jgi:GntR family transcriptional regulator/MocR family aminotransferase
MRALYAGRQAALVNAAQDRLQGLLHVEPSAAGMHLLGWLPPGCDDALVSRRLARANIDASPLSAHAIALQPPPALILGYTGLNERAIRNGVKRMAEALRD